MKQSTVVFLAGIVISGTAWTQTSVTPAQGPVAEPAPVAVPVATPVSVKVPKTWVDYITFKGDVRLRGETINDDSKKNSSGEDYTRDRARIRARLKVEAKVNDLKVGIRLSTGGADPVSGNQTLGDGFQKKDIRLDLAYIDYSFLGDSPDELRAIGGKMENPLITMPDDLVWDPDLTPEGLAVKARFGNDFVTVLLNGEGLFIQERDAQKNATGLAGQAALKFQFMPEIGLTVGGTYLAYQNIQGYDVIDWENKNNSYGNSTIPGSVSGSTTNKAWADEFTPVMGFVQLDLWLGFPISFYGQALTNPKADANKNGYMGGVSLGKAKTPKTFEVGYSYTKLEKDATLGMFTDSDRWGGGTDGKGSKFYAKYQITKNLQACATFFLDQKKISAADGGTNYNRLQIDLQAAF
ncbi:MAG: putative porin [Verrucomicrobia bacterium]|nr:putative porin [Verrucomicrobiota bacterium]MBU1733609.1 putative porin [Verrucomicrobiota bacterium]